MPQNPPLLPPPPERDSGWPPPGHLAQDDTQMIPRAEPDQTVPNWERMHYAPPPAEAPPTQGWYAGPPPAKPPRRKKWRKVLLVIALCLVGLVVLAAALGSLAGKPKPAAASSPAPAASVTQHAKPKHKAPATCGSKLSSWLSGTGRADLSDLSSAVLAMGNDDTAIRDDMLNSGTVASADNTRLMTDTARVDGIALRMKLKDPQPPSCVPHLRHDYRALASDAEASGVDQLLMGGAINQSNWAMASAYLSLSISSLTRADSDGAAIKSDLAAYGQAV